MERIRKALERAGQDRMMTATDVLRQAPPGVQADLSTGVRYTMTKTVEVTPQQLLDKRIIAALPEHKFKDSYRMLRTRVLQTMRNNGWTSVAVTGPATGCGKTLTAINLAVSLAMEVSHTVLLVDLDLRKPTIHKYFGYEMRIGVAAVAFPAPDREQEIDPGFVRHTGQPQIVRPAPAPALRNLGHRPSRRAIRAEQADLELVGVVHRKTVAGMRITSQHDSSPSFPAIDRRASS